MTLIVSHLNDVMGVVAFSDIITSTRTRPDGASLDIPFRETPIVLSNWDYSPSGFAQKMVIFGRTVILWANQKIAAQQLINNIRQISLEGTVRVNLDQVIESYGDDRPDLDCVSFVYHFYDEDEETLIARFAWQCDEVERNGLSTVISGSGIDSYFNSFDYTENEGRFGAGVLLPEIMSKIASHSIVESLGDISLDQLYGGWFELFTPRSGYFHKLPYAVKYWSIEADLLVEQALFFGVYDGDNLCVIRKRPGETPQAFPVQDFLRRLPDNSITREVQPAFVVHVVKFGPVLFRSYIEPYPLTSCEMDLSFNNGQLIEWWSRKLRRRLKTLTANGDIGQITVQLS